MSLKKILTAIEVNADTCLTSFVKWLEGCPHAHSVEVVDAADGASALAAFAPATAPVAQPAEPPKYVVKFNGNLLTEGADFDVAHNLATNAIEISINLADKPVPSQPPVDNDHVAEDATQFTAEEIALNAPLVGAAAEINAAPAALILNDKTDA